MSVKNSILPREQQQEGPKTLPMLLESPAFKGRFEQVLGKRAPQFMSSVLSAVSANGSLKEANPMTIIQSAMKAAVLDLPIDSNLGFAYIVPYKNKGKKEAQFQLGYKGLIQLAQRSGQYKSLNVMDIRDGELISFNRLSEELDVEFVEDDVERNELPVVGYAGYFKLINGFEKTVYWTKAGIEKHAMKYSQSYKQGFGPWKDDFDGMAKKTVIKNMLSKWGILSVDIQTAIEADQAVIDESGNPLYVDNSDYDGSVIEPSFTEEPEITDAAQEHPQPDMPCPVQEEDEVF